jgi:small-conductance mechanosensitive channel
MAFRLIAIVSLLLSFWSLPLYAQDHKISKPQDNPQLSGETESAPVTLDGVDLFLVRGIRSFPADLRAKEITKRIIQVAEDPKLTPDSIQMDPGKFYTAIKAGPITIMQVADVDAALENLSRPVYADVIRRVIGKAIQDYREDRQPKKIRNDILYSLAATLILAFILFILSWGFGRLKKIFKRRQSAAGEKTIQWRSVNIIEANRFWKGLSWVFGTIRFILTLILLYLYLQFTLGLFPWTRFIATRLLGLVANPLKTIFQSILGYIPNLFFLMVLGIFVYLLLKFIKSFFASIERGTFALPSFEREWARPTYRIVRVLILIFSLVVAYPYIPGSSSAAFKGISIFMGVLLSLGSSSTVSNMIAGYSLIYRRAFKLGDRIQIGDIVGDVILMRLQATHLLTIKNETVTIPNSNILSTHVINYSNLAQTQGLILHTTVGIGYEVPWRQVEAMLIRAAEKTTGILKEPPPFVLQKGLGDFAVNYEINAYCHEPQKMAQIYTDLHRQILDEFNEHGVQIMTPAYRGDPENPKLVPKSDWFKPPASK